MDFSKLTQNEKLAVYGAAASIIGPLVATAGFGFGVSWLTLLLAIAMLAIVFLPQLSPQTQLPGSKGSLMLIVGGIAALSAVLALFSLLTLLALSGLGLFTIGMLIAIAGGLLMGWAGWQEFQAEGGKFRLGTAPSRREDAPPSTSSSEASTPPPAATPPPATPPPPADEPGEAPPRDTDDRPTS